MSTSQGWYPDPGGQRGMYRYWDGTQWSEQLSATPAAAPPTSPVGGAEPPPAGTAPLGSTTPYGSSASGSASYGASNASWNAQPKKRNPVPWVIAGVVVASLLIGGFFIVPRLGGARMNPFDPTGGGGSQNPCPPQSTSIPTPYQHPNDGRVHGGPMSYPLLSSPWRAPKPDVRVPFGRDVASQDVMVEENYSGMSSWVASVLVAELMAGDGFYSPQEGASIVAQCVTGVFYGNAVVTRDDKVNEAITVDGHDAWILESHLSFDIKGLQTKGELMIIVVVAVDDFRGGLYYASIPDTTPELVEPARNLIKQLKVGA